MCLSSIRKSPHVLKRDKRCWKVMYWIPKNNRLESVYMLSKYNLGELRTEDSAADVKISPGHHPRRYEIGGGYIHAFTTLDEAKILCYRYRDVYDPDGRDAVICECTIPAGTAVYSNRIFREICARAMRIDKIIEL